MVAYHVDTAAVMDAVRSTEEELAGLASAPSDLRRGVHTVETALGSSRVAAAFSAYGNGELLPRWRSVVSRAENAVQGVTQAVAEYLRADEEMRARAEAAAAAVPKPSGRRLPAPFPQPLLPPPQEPDPEPGTLVPLPGPPPWNPEWLFRPALPGRPPFVVARDLMLRLRFPCPGHWYPHPGCRPRWWGPAYPPCRPPGGWLPRWPEPCRPPGAWYPRWPEPGPWPYRPPGGWYPRWPEPGLPPQGRFPWWPARPLPGVIPDPRIIPPPGSEYAWPLEVKRLPFALAVNGPDVASRENSGGRWGLT